MHPENDKPYTIHHTLYTILLILSLSLIGCKPEVVEEAETLLCEADSLRVKGIVPTDSALWAETVAAMRPWRLFYPTDYAKANYYYGYLLRTKGHHPQAMQCFIDASKAKTNDHVLLGRIYSNIADMCRLEGNYDLAYSIYENSRDQFKQGENNRMYYYAINNLALQRAFQKDKPAAYELLSVIERECTDSAVLTKTLETKAIACRYMDEQDSALYYAIRLQENGNREPTGYMIKAQVYSKLGIADSAVYYAQYIMEHSASITDKYNALYILSHKDKDLSNDSVLTLTSQRADLGAEYTHRQESLSHAVEIYQQSIKPDYRWIYGIVVTVIVIGLILLIILLSTKKRRNLAQRQIEQQAQNIEQQYIQNCTNLSHLTTVQFANTVNWKNFDDMCKYINAALNNFADTLQQQYPSLTERELRLCILVLMNFSAKKASESSNILQRRKLAVQ